MRGFPAKPMDGTLEDKYRWLMQTQSRYTILDIFNRMEMAFGIILTRQQKADGMDFIISNSTQNGKDYTFRSN